MYFWFYLWMMTAIAFTGFMLFLIGLFIASHFDRTYYVSRDDWLNMIGMNVVLILFQCVFYLMSFVSLGEINNGDYAWVLEQGKDNSVFMQEAERLFKNDDKIDGYEFWHLRSYNTEEVKLDIEEGPTEQEELNSLKAQFESEVK